jgi:hypothetical protein
MEKKNVWLLPTDKPSRLWINKITDKIELSDSSDVLGALNIYITSDEEPKHLDYYITKIKDSNGERYIVGQRLDINDSDYSNCKKIILTTDQDLIKDGVQAIDDDFLEWFVKNPSCESVEIENNWEFLGDDYRRGGEQTLVYKIIIPKEETKQDYSGVHLRHCYQGEYKDGCKYGEDACPAKPLEPKQDLLKQYPLTPDKCFKQEPKQQTYIQSETMVVGMGYTSEDGSTKFVTKQETLEEQMYKASFANESPLWHDGFIAGSNWQAERMYSEEEVLNIIALYVKDEPHYTKKWFEQFKKK